MKQVRIAVLFLPLLAIAQSPTEAASPSPLQHWSSFSAQNRDGGPIETLGRISHTTKTEAWALGKSAFEDGSPQMVLMHSADGGKSWKQHIPTYPTASVTTFTFVNPKHGWVSGSDRGTSEAWLMQTSDGGKTWKTITERLFTMLIFLDEKEGYGADAHSFWRTSDGGKSWRPLLLPEFSATYSMRVLGKHSIWVLGNIESTLHLARSADQGAVWKITAMPFPQPVQHIVAMDLQRDSLHGWIVGWYDTRLGSGVLETWDGGDHWSFRQDLDTLDQARWITAALFPGNQEAYLWGADESKGSTSAFLMTSQDAGAHWSTQTLDHAVRNCRSLKQGVLCTAEEPSLLFSMPTQKHPKK